MNYVPPLAALAVVSRALGPYQFGRYSVLMAVGAYVALLVDFGFNVTATKAVAQSANELSIGAIFAAVTGAKIAISLLALLVVAGVALVSDFAVGQSIPFAMVLIQAVSTALTPTWLFIGLQRAESLAVPFGVCRVAAALAAAALIRGPSDMALFATVNAIGAVALLVWVLTQSVHLGGPLACGDKRLVRDQ